jgi:hypothetical protein
VNLSDAIGEALRDNPGANPITLTDAVVLKLGPAWIGISLRAQRLALGARIARLQAKMPDPRQLDLPGFLHVVVQPGETLEQYRTTTAKLALRLKSYDYARRRPEKRKADERMLRERIKLDRKMTPFFEGDALMTVPRAVELLADLYAKSSETTRIHKRRPSA